jgi:hypothetical protein
MKTKQPYFLPEDELSLRLSRLLLLIDALSFNKKGSLVLTLEKIVIFEFLTKYPELLYRLNLILKNTSFELSAIETHSIEALFPNRQLLFDFKETKKIVQLLIAHGYVEIKIEEGFEIFFHISAEGKLFVNNLNSLYFKRLREITDNLKLFLAYSYSQLNKQIEPFIRYGIRN